MEDSLDEKSRLFREALDNEYVKAVFLQDRVFPSSQIELEKIQDAFDKGCENVKVYIYPVDSLFTEETVIKMAQQLTVHFLTQEDEYMVASALGLILRIKDPKRAYEVMCQATISDVPVKTCIMEDSFTFQYIIKVDPTLLLSEVEKNLQHLGARVQNIIRLPYVESDPPTASLLVKEIGSITRYRVEIENRVYKVLPFLEKPSICLNCWKWGHLINKCTKEAACPKCGEFHSPDECDEEPGCFRCEYTDHTAQDERCPLHCVDTKIFNLAKEHNLSFEEARILFDADSDCDDEYVESINYRELLENPQAANDPFARIRMEKVRRLQFVRQLLQNCVDMCDEPKRCRG